MSSVPNTPGNYVPVRTSVVLQTLIQAMLEQIEQRAGEPLDAAIGAVLTAGPYTANAGEVELDRALRHAGYTARIVEVEMFEPAQQSADWAADLLREGFARCTSWSDAMTAVCAQLTRSEPLDKPSPDDPSAMSWRVPGPGGHVRHFLALRTIEEQLRGRSTPLEGDPAELKRAWMYGFFVRTCEEALPPEAVLEAP
jgi:hypothetical protein